MDHAPEVRTRADVALLECARDPHTRGALAGLRGAASPEGRVASRGAGRKVRTRLLARPRPGPEVSSAITLRPSCSSSARTVLGESCELEITSENH